MIILDFIKGVVNKMFNKTEVSKAFKTNVAISSDMNEAIRLWSQIYNNKAPWLNKDVKSLNLGAQIAHELAKLVVLEFKSEITGSKRADYLNDIYKNVIDKLLQNVEYANAKGGMIFKPYVSNNKVEIDYIQADKFIPVEFDSNGKMISAIFISQITKGDNIYTRLEMHKLKAAKKEYIIINKAFKSRNVDTLGNEISLSNVEEWQNIQEETVITKIDTPLFAYYKVPQANNIDSSSPLGVSCYNRAVEFIRDADEQYGRTMWEYEASEKAVYVDSLALNNNNKTRMDKISKRLYRSLDVGQDDFYKDYSPEIRDEAFWRGLNNILRKIEFNCGLAYGTISDPNEIEKTAEEIRTSKKRSFDTVSTMQASLENALKDLIYAINVLVTLYELCVDGKYEISINWNDSILSNLEKEREQDMKDVAAGIMNNWEYRMKWYGETEEQAKANLPETPNIIL